MENFLNSPANENKEKPQKNLGASGNLTSAISRKSKTTQDDEEEKGEDRNGTQPFIVENVQKKVSVVQI